MQEEVPTMEEGIMENMSENGVQRLSDMMIEQRSEEDTPMLHLELEDSEDTNIHEMNIGQSEEIEQDVEDMVHIYTRFLFNSRLRFYEHLLVYHFIYVCMCVCTYVYTCAHACVCQLIVEYIFKYYKQILKILIFHTGSF